MREHTFDVVTTSAASPTQVFDLLADAPRWREWAGSSIRESAWIRGSGDVGSVRRLGRRPLYTTETITELRRPHRMGWTVAGLPVRAYRCTVELTPTDSGGTEIRWSGRFTAPGPFAALLRPALQRTVGGFAVAAAAAAATRNIDPTDQRL
jgi:uncharacterized protein YndB with AHSA1/START domain